MTKRLDFNQWCGKLMLVLKMKTVTARSSAEKAVSFRNQNLNKKLRTLFGELTLFRLKASEGKFL